MTPISFEIIGQGVESSWYQPRLRNTDYDPCLDLFLWDSWHPYLLLSVWNLWRHDQSDFYQSIVWVLCLFVWQSLDNLQRASRTLYYFMIHLKLKIQYFDLYLIWRSRPFTNNVSILRSLLVELQYCSQLTPYYFFETLCRLSFPAVIIQ